MKTKFSPILTITLAALVMAMILPLRSYASSTPAGVLGPVWTDGTAYSGGSNFYYRLTVTANVSGTLAVQAQVKAKGWKTKFPILSTAVPVGDSTVSGPAIAVPNNFQGSATLKVTVTLNGLKVGKKTITVQIAPFPSGTTTSTLLDVGFNNLVTLDGTVVRTNGMGPSLTYSWTQLSGIPVTLSATDVVAPTFTTDPLTNFVLTGTTATVNDVDDQGFTNALYVRPEFRFGTNAAKTTVRGIAIDVEQESLAANTFRLLVSDGSTTRTGTFSVAYSSHTPAHPNIPVGVKAFYMGATNSIDWTLQSKPLGSSATLTHTNELVAQLLPDIEGVYIIKDNVTGKSVTNTAASWVGYQACAICHGPGNNVGQVDLVSTWQQTKHASFFQRAIDGALTPYYNQSCIKCHTVGYNKAPGANNGGFDDVATALGWQFPSTLTAGNYAAMPDALKNLANIQCESCHGPGSRHPGEPSISMDVKVCAQCHQDGHYHVRPEQWDISPHAGAFEVISNSRGIRQDCARCHSGQGFMDAAKGGFDFRSGTNNVTTGAGPLTCQACHDPHKTYDNPDRFQLRVFDEALFGNPYFRSNNVYVALGDSITTADLRLTNSNLIVTNAGASAACMACHNGRQLPTQVQVYGSAVGKMFYQVGGPHDQLAGEVFSGVGTYDYGQVMGNSFHTYLADCQACHQHKLQAGDTIMVNDSPLTLTSGNLADYANLVGDHTFKMDYVWLDTNGVENVIDNIAACNQCHASFEPVESFDFKTANGHDYDGNGVKEGVQTEVKGLLRELADVIVWGTNATPANGTSVTNSVIYVSTNATAEIWMPLVVKRTIASGVTNYITTVDTVNGSLVSGFSSDPKVYGLGNTNNVALVEAQRKAVWNWLVAYREGSFGIHNTQFSIRLLQTSYTDVSTNSTGNAANTFQNAFPSAFLR